MNHPNYKHRAFASCSVKAEDFGDIDLVDSIDFSVIQAEAMIEQMQNQFEGHGNIAPDACNYAVLDAIKKELLDIKVIVHWHIQNNLDKRMENKS